MMVTRCSHRRTRCAAFDPTQILWRHFSMAQRAKSHIRHVKGAHPSMIEHPEATVAAIVEADGSTK
jgi:hypothetical protein